jgi:octaprenyl-diphosphate synthase
VIRIIKKESHKKSKVKEVIEFVKKSGGIEYAQAQMNKYVDMALSMLDKYPDGAHKTSLHNLVEFAISRKK